LNKFSIQILFLQVGVVCSLSDHQREQVDIEQLLLSQLYTLQALVNVLERKGLLTKEELLEELTELEKATCGEHHPQM
jgi:predicted amino acid-binding ACT domain protein